MTTPGILVLEGAEAAGKTTLARYLRRHHGARYVHLGPYRDPWRWYLGGYLWAARLAALGHLVVVDRHWPSELVYGEVYRGGSAWPVAARCFDRLLLRASALYVLCAPRDVGAQLDAHRHRTDLATKANRYARDRERSVAGVTLYYRALRDPSHVPAARREVGRGGYLDRCYLSGRPWSDRADVEVYDRFAEGEELASVAARLLRALAARRRSQFPLAHEPALPGFAGHAADARYLVLGEAPPPGRPRRLAFPFVDRCDRLSSATGLNHALHELGIDEPQLAWANARAWAGDRAPSLELRNLAGDPRLRRLPVLALGRVATRTACDLRFDDVRELPQPDGNGYAKRLAEAL